MTLRSQLLSGHLELEDVTLGARVLAHQSRGDAVMAVQRGLADLGYLGGSTDGICGRQTAEALRWFQREHGVAVSGCIDRATVLALDDALLNEVATQAESGSIRPPRDVYTAAFHAADERSQTYKEAVAAWSDDTPIWRALKTQKARERWVRFLVRQDDTNTRRYQDFDNLCTGFAAQIYARYSSHSRLSARALRTLEQVAVHAGTIAPKYRVPVFMVINRGHAFNAFLLDETRADALDAYLIYEPQNDAFISRTHPYWHLYIERFGASVCELADFTHNRKYEFSKLHEFVLNGRGDMVRVSSDRVANLAKDFAIAESGSQNYDYYIGRAGSFEKFLRQQAAEVWRLRDQEVIEVGRVLQGRMFRTTVGGVAKPMTARLFVELLDRSDLYTHLV